MVPFRPMPLWTRQSLLFLLWPLFVGTGTSAQECGAPAEELTYEWLDTEVLNFCREVETPIPQLDERSEYPPVPYEEQEGYETREFVQQQWRGQNGMKNVVQRCPFASCKEVEEGTCSAELMSYAESFVMLAAPTVLAVFFLLGWHVCCWVAFFRCCRRCCCCQERKGYREARHWEKLAMLIMGLVGSIIVIVTAGLGFLTSGQINTGIADVLCHMIGLVDETLGGSAETPIFLGMDEGIQRLETLSLLMDADSKALTEMRNILDDTGNFATAYDDLMLKINHMRRMLMLVGQRKTYEHDCWFCRRALGNNATGEVGLLSELVREVQQSAAEPMREIQLEAVAALTGQRLAQSSRAVVRARIALENFRRSFRYTFADTILEQRRLVQTFEDIRHTFFRYMAAFSVVHALIVSNCVLVQGRRSKSKYPAATPACASMFCGFLALTLGTAFSGILMLISVPLSELCNFWRYELLTPDGPGEYYRQLGLFDATNPSEPVDLLAVNVFRTCLTPEGDGGILTALSLKHQLAFQMVLDQKYEDLEDKMAGRVIDVAKFELLLSQAEAFGGLFILNPDEPLPLGSNAVEIIIGSSVDIDDQFGPDGQSVIFGLNSFAAAIAGHGQYNFESGTSGGGTRITATRPTDAEISGEPLQVRNAVYYGRRKERLLTEGGLFHCDIMDSGYRVTPRTCGLAEFKSSIRDWARQVKEAGARLDQEAQWARTHISIDFRDSLKGILVEVRRLRTLFRCRFLWRRWEDLDFLLCNRVLPAMLQGTAAWGVLGFGEIMLVVLHYKIWRHFLDNRIVGEELDRFSKKYGHLHAVERD